MSKWAHLFLWITALVLCSPLCAALVLVSGKSYVFVAMAFGGMAMAFTLGAPWCTPLFRQRARLCWNPNHDGLSRALELTKDMHIPLMDGPQPWMGEDTRRAAVAIQHLLARSGRALAFAQRISGVSRSSPGRFECDAYGVLANALIEDLKAVREETETIIADSQRLRDERTKAKEGA